MLLQQLVITCETQDLKIQNLLEELIGQDQNNLQKSRNNEDTIITTSVLQTKTGNEILLHASQYLENCKSNKASFIRSTKGHVL